MCTRYRFGLSEIAWVHQKSGRPAAALTDKINDREVYMKGVDASYHYEGYDVYRTADIKDERSPKKADRGAR